MELEASAQSLCLSAIENLIEIGIDLAPAAQSQPADTDQDGDEQAERNGQF